MLFLDNDMEIEMEKLTPTLTLCLWTNEKAGSAAKHPRKS
jgi:hypothetical protein